MRGKKNLILFECILSRGIEVYTPKCHITVRLLGLSDMEQIRATFFPLLRGDLRLDREYYQEFESNPVSHRRCFVAEVNAKIVHHSWVTTGVARSGGVVIGSAAAYIGPCFTLPQYRGLGIYPHVLTVILRYLQREGIAKALIQARKDNTPSIRSIQKAGFSRSHRA
jgi:GNAT superfamily N-acetyltransferase